MDWGAVATVGVFVAAGVAVLLRRLSRVETLLESVPNRLLDHEVRISRLEGYTGKIEINGTGNHARLE